MSFAGQEKSCEVLGLAALSGYKERVEFQQETVNMGTFCDFSQVTHTAESFLCSDHFLM